MFGNHTPEGDVIEQDRNDRSSYCEHGTFIGNAFGGDYLCGPCESGEDVMDAHEELRQAVEDRLPAGVQVDVSEWAGCDEPWDDPVYVTALDPDEEVEYIDAICDLTSAPFAEQVDFIIDQLVNG